MGTPLIANDSDDGEAASSSTNAAEEQRPYLGIQFDRTHDGDGVRVGRVFPNSTASRMGIERNDVITAINDTTIDSASQLQDIINNSSVGEDISVTWQRDGEEQQGQAALASLPRQRLEARQLAELRENVRSLQSQRAALQGAGDDDAISVAEAMHGLATTLNELPERIEQAAQQFKELYPDGSFTVHIEIDIRTNAKEENPFDISPQQGANDGDTADTAKEGAATDEDNIAEEAEDAEEDDENPDQEE
ncbi:MAG: PDZ domain-containing protein [Planctomycetota bacterium]|nr:MAG: PDZ domain-containing protein [Planctomycetota bacterium]